MKAFFSRCPPVSCSVDLPRMQTRTPVVQEESPDCRRTFGHDLEPRSGSRGPPVILVHGFGGNCDHWRKNLPYLGQDFRTYAIDLLGFGFSDKPDPRLPENSELYTFDTWAKQIADFAEDVAKEPSFLVCNSIGGNRKLVGQLGVAGLHTAVEYPEHVRAVQLLNVSLRQLHVRNQNRFMRPVIRAFQYTVAGEIFFDNVAKPETVRKILEEAYYDADAVTDELVELILKPGMEPGASRVFLAFISYSGGPLPGEMLEQVTQPVSILWGREDPWERIEQGRSFASLSSVEEFIEVPEGGHCIMCEKSEIVNPLIQRFIYRHHSLPVPKI